MDLQCRKRRIHSRFAPAESLTELETDLSEDPLMGELRDAMRATGYFVSVPCEIKLHVSPEGHVSLWGIVPSYYLKQRAQVAAMSVDGVQSLQNDLVVL